MVSHQYETLVDPIFLVFDKTRDINLLRQIKGIRVELKLKLIMIAS